MDDFRPLDAFSLSMRAPNSAGVLATGAEAERLELLLHVGQHDQLPDLGIELVDDLLRRAGRQHDAGERIAFVARDAGFRGGRGVGQGGEPACAEHRERAQLALLDIAMAGGNAVKAIGVWPPMVEVTAGAAPVNGTIARSSPKASLNNSPLRCGVEPVAGWAKLNFPGLALISAISSLTSLAATAGLTVSTLGEAATRVSGRSPYLMSYGTPLA